MKCKRCGKDVDTTIPELNAENYGENIWACRYCGQAYHFYRAVCCETIDTDMREDDWGKRIIKCK